MNIFVFILIVVINIYCLDLILHLQGQASQSVSTMIFSMVLQWETWMAYLTCVMNVCERLRMIRDGQQCFLKAAVTTVNENMQQ
jgi:hypothetical protein